MHILTGIQPSGSLHIGNYFGTIKQMLDLQNSKKSGDEVFMFVADLHALTSLRDGNELRKNVNDVILDYLACGIDPEKTILYVQSDIPEVTELAWYLSTVTPMWQMEQAHSYKDKVAKGISSNVGLFTYPVLMAADILIADTNIVPVGKDQIQHVEIARDLAKKFNNEYGEVFTIPEVRVCSEVQVVPGIDGQKMSKSYKNTIPLFGSESEIKKAVMSIVTDSAGVTDKKDPDKCNIFAIYKLVANEDEISEMKQKYLNGGFGYGDAKKELLEKIKRYFGPMWEIREKLKGEKGKVEEVRIKGAEKMRKYALKVMEKCRKKVGVR